MNTIYNVSLVSTVDKKFSHSFDLGFIKKTSSEIANIVQELENDGEKFKNYRNYHIEAELVEIHNLKSMKNVIIAEINNDPMTEKETVESNSDDYLYNVLVNYLTKDGEISYIIDLGIVSTNIFSEDDLKFELIKSIGIDTQKIDLDVQELNQASMDDLKNNLTEILDNK